MTRPLLDQFLARLRAEYPSYTPFVQPWRRDDPDIEYFIDLLNVPIDVSITVAFRTLDLAHEVYGEVPIPFHIAPLDPEQSAKYLPQALEDERKRRERLGA
jgi:hypothetical protein